MGARTCSQIARQLPLHGWDPIVLTVHEQYIESAYLEQHRSLPDPHLTVIRTGKLLHPLSIYRWLNSLRQDETAQHSDSTMKSSELSQDEKGFLRRQALSLLSTPDMHTGWIFPAILAGRRAIRRSQAEHIFSSGPYWTAHLIGYALARLTDLPWTAHFRDPWFTGAEAKKMTEVWPRLDAALERMVVKRADAVVCVTEAHTALLRQKYREFPAEKFTTISNGFDNSEWISLPSAIESIKQKNDRFTITYAGQLYMNRSPLPLFRALRILIDAGEIVQEKVQIDLIGWCDLSEGQQVTEMIAENGLGDCVNITGPRGRAETLERLIKSDLLLLLAEDLTMQIPGKTFEYLKAGRPILALTGEGAVAQLLRQTGGGWVVNPADEIGLQNALRERYQQWLADESGPVADPIVVAGFDRSILTGRLAKLFDHPGSLNQQNCPSANQPEKYISSGESAS
ncbi:MAG TPA: glycosyltransferase [Blastocatellia bacterium]|nr:glycosyltransferase [Blastocatellia bacterium]